MELQVIWLSLQGWTILLEGHLIWIQSNSAMAVAYINHQGGARSLCCDKGGIVNPGQNNVFHLCVPYTFLA